MPLLTESKVFIRPDGPDKVTGSGRYVADITLTGMLTAKFLYAGISHAEIIRLDVSAAVKTRPGSVSGSGVASGPSEPLQVREDGPDGDGIVSGIVLVS